MSQEDTASGQTNSDERESLVSKDADPVPPRGQPNERGACNQGGPEVVHRPQSPDREASVNTGIPMPDPNWRFNSFLVDLADEIDGDELDKLKAMYIDIIGRRVLEKLTTARGLFDHLRKLTHLSKDNVVCLQALLMKLKRPELTMMAIDFAKSVGDLMYLYPASEPENGYRNVKFHVEGKDFRNCTQSYVRKLRTELSHWLFIPPEHVLIAGIEPSSSMVITIMIPDMYADILEKMLLDNKDALQPFAELEIDFVQIHDTTFNIRGIEEAEVVETEQQTKLVSVYEQLQDKTRQLDSMEHEVIKLSEEQKRLNKHFDELEVESVTLRNLFYTSENGKQIRPTSLASQVALKQFHESLQEMKTKNYDMAVIRKLLDANSEVIAKRSREMYVINLQQLNLQVQELQSQLMPLQFEVLFSRTNEAGNLEKLLRESLLKLLEAISVTDQEVEQALTDYGNEILKKISRSLRYREKQKLEKKYTWDPNDDLTKCKDSNYQSLFLSCLFYKEIERIEGVVDFVSFVEGCLTDVNRPDLIRKFQDMMAKSKRQSRPRNRTSSAPGTQREATPTQATEGQLDIIGEEVHVIMEKVNGIENTITSAMNYGQPYDQPFASKPFSTRSYGANFGPSNMSQDK